MPTPQTGIRTQLLVPTALLVTLAVLLTSILGYRFGTKATDELVGQLVAQSTDRLRTHLRSYLDKAQLATGVAAETLRLGALDPNELFEHPEPWFSAQHRLFTSVDDLYFARSDGAITGMDKVNDRLLLKLTTTFPQRSFYLLDQQGQRGPALRSEDYDARTREWFKSALAAGGPVWSRIYVLQNKDALGITAARPASDRQGRMAGVMGANLTLSSLSEYLKQHTVQGQAIAYLVEPDGALVASSALSARLARQEPGKPAQRVLAAESNHAVLAASFQALQRERARTGASPDLPLAIDTTVEGTRYRVHHSALKNELGLDWHLVSVVDPDFHLGGVRAAAQTTLAIGTVLLLALLGLVAATTRRLAAPIQLLSQAARRTAQGHYGQTVNQVGGGREIGELVSAFNDMSIALHQAVSKVVSHATQLEVEVANRTAELTLANQALARSHDEAHRASEAKSSFMAQLSHEIRTPLQTLSGTCYLMRNEGLTPEQDQRVAALEAASQHMLGVVNSVLDLAKIEAGHFQLDESPLWVQALVANVLSMLSGQASAKALALESQVDPMPEGLWGDRIRLQQMLLNYAANAVKFTASGRVVVSARALEVSERDALIRFDVVDTGPAIAPEVLARLFEPFVQGDARHQAGGTGLGLAITRQLARLMGGNAGAQAMPEGGNRFHFSVRLSRRAADETAAPTMSSGAAETRLRHEFAGARVLVCEDEPINRLITQTMLQRAGLQADLAGNGIEAVRLAGENDYALILMDMQMAGLDGVEAARQIRRLPRHADTPIVATTANVYMEDRQRCFDAGMDEFLSKPMEVHEFFATLHRCLSRG